MPITSDAVADPEALIHGPDSLGEGRITLVFLWVTMQQRLYRDLGSRSESSFYHLPDLEQKHSKSQVSYGFGVKEFTTVSSLDQTSWCCESSFPFAPIKG